MKLQFSRSKILDHVGFSEKQAGIVILREIRQNLFWNLSFELAWIQNFFYFEMTEKIQKIFGNFKLLFKNVWKVTLQVLKNSDVSLIKVQQSFIWTDRI